MSGIVWSRYLTKYTAAKVVVLSRHLSMSIINLTNRWPQYSSSFFWEKEIWMIIRDKTDWTMGSHQGEETERFYWQRAGGGWHRGQCYHCECCCWCCKCQLCCCQCCKYQCLHWCQWQHQFRGQKWLQSTLPWSLQCWWDTKVSGDVRII